MIDWFKKRKKKKGSEAAAQMNSLTAKPCLIYQPTSSSIIVVSCRPKSFSSVRCPIKTTKNNNGRLAFRIRAYDSSKNESNNGSNDSKPPNGTLVFLYFTLLLRLLWWFSFTILLSPRQGCLSITKMVFFFFLSNAFALFSSNMPAAVYNSPDSCKIFYVFQCLLQLLIAWAGFKLCGSWWVALLIGSPRAEGIFYWSMSKMCNQNLWSCLWKGLLNRFVFSSLFISSLAVQV